MGYLQSLFSIKKITHKYISIFAIWDSTTKFTKYSAIRRGARCTHVTMGDYSSISNKSDVGYTTIGRFSVIARNCDIGIGNHPTNRITSHSIFYKNRPWGFHPEWCLVENFDDSRKGVTIENDVWIGASCLVMDGVTIHNGAIVAAGAVVTKDVPPFAVVGGVPAKVIKYRFSKEVIDKLIEIQWWNMTDEQISKNIDIFHKENITLEDLEKFKV